MQFLPITTTHLWRPCTRAERINQVNQVSEAIVAARKELTTIEQVLVTSANMVVAEAEGITSLSTVFHTPEGPATS